jgi:hypothetical protein
MGEQEAQCDFIGCWLKRESIRCRLVRCNDINVAEFWEDARDGLVKIYEPFFYLLESADGCEEFGARCDPECVILVYWARILCDTCMADCFVIKYITFVVLASC